MFVFGTRPEAIKMCPLILELQNRPDFAVKVCVTGQHREMLDQVLKVFAVEPDYDLEIMRPDQTLSSITTEVLEKLKPILEEEKPDILLVHGDTSTTFASSLAAFYAGVKVGHVEAGLRTYNLQSPYPEEFNRQAVSILADYHFAPTEEAKANLIREGKEADRIFVTGNTVIDALSTTIDQSYQHDLIDWAKGGRLILITAHRRENLGRPMLNMFRAIKRVMEEHPDVRAVYPIHKNPKVRDLAQEVFGQDSKIKLIEPLEMVDFHNFMKASYLILTDSGGVQEEAPSLGKPVLVMRDTTERPEGLAAGTLKLVGTSEASIYRHFKKLLEDEAIYQGMSQASNPYGDGRASQRIATVLAQN